MLLQVLLLIFSSLFIAALDDNQQRWASLMDSQLKDWYTSYDLCMVKNSSKIAFNDVSKNCEVNQ